jgi:hypothetical protein
MTAGKLGGNWSTENIVDGSIEHPTQGGVYLCAISANGLLFTSIIFVSLYHGNAWGTTSTAISYGEYFKSFTQYDNSNDKIVAIATDISGTTTYSANIISYYKII